LRGVRRFWDFLPYDPLSSDDSEELRIAKTLLCHCLMCEQSLPSGVPPKIFQVEDFWNGATEDRAESFMAFANYLGIDVAVGSVANVVGSMGPANSISQRSLRRGGKATRTRSDARDALMSSPEVSQILERLADRYGYQRDR
jgi:hypothetical protein